MKMKILPITIDIIFESAGYLFSFELWKDEFTISRLLNNNIGDIRKITIPVFELKP